MEKDGRESKEVDFNKEKQAMGKMEEEKGNNTVGNGKE